MPPNISNYILCFAFFVFSYLYLMIVKIYHQSQHTQQYSFSENKILVYVGRKPHHHLPDPHQSITLDQPTASRNHLAIKYKNQKIYLKDLQSRNGTKINGQQIQSDSFLRVNQGDTIQIGESETTLKIELRDQSESQSQKQPQQIERHRSRDKKAGNPFKISESTLKMLKQMTSDKKTKEERVRFLKLMGCKNVDDEWQQIEKYLKKNNKFPSSNKKANEELEKQFTAGRSTVDKLGLGSFKK